MLKVKKIGKNLFLIIVVTIVVFLAYKITILSNAVKNQEVRISELSSQISLTKQAEAAGKTQEQDNAEALIKNIGNGHWGNICSQDKVVDGRVDTQSAIVFFDKANCPPPFKAIRVWVMSGTRKY